MKRTYVYWVLIISLLLLSAAGCGNSNNNSTPPSTNSNAAPLSAVLMPDSGASRVSEFQSRGNLNPAGAAFLAATKLEISSPQKNLYQFTATFPGNAIADMTLRVITDQKYTPTADEGNLQIGKAYQASLTHSITGDDYHVELKYFLLQGSLPVAFHPGREFERFQPLALINGSSLIPHLANYVARNTDDNSDVPAQNGEEQSGIFVEFIATVKEAGKEFISAFEEGYREGSGIKGAPLSEAIFAGLDVFEAANMGADYQAMVSELDELEVMAEYPTNPLTQKAYAEDPGLKQQILDEIADARTDLKVDTMVAFLNTEASVALGLSGSPALAIAAAPITTWNSETIKQLMRQRIEIVRKMIATGYFETDQNSTDSTPDPSDTENTSTPGSTTGDDLYQPKPGEWSATYEAQNQTISSVGGTSLVFTDNGIIHFKVQDNGTVEGTGTGHLIFHGEEPNGTTDGQTGYSFKVSGVVMDGKVQFTMIDELNPMMFSVVTVDSQGQRETSQVPVTAPLMLAGPVELKIGGTASFNSDVNPQGIRTIATATLTIN